MARGAKPREGLIVDLPLLSLLVLLLGVSLAVLYSAGGEDTNLLTKQGIRMLFALLLMLAVAQVSPKTLAHWSPHIYGAGLLLLILVLVFGIIGKGAQRWLDLGLFRFQPSEVMKLGAPMMVAWLLTRRSLPPRFGMLVLALLLIMAPTALVALQPDLGTAILIATAGLVVIFLGGVGWRWVLGALALLAAAAPLLWTFFMHDYQRRRVLTLFDPWSDPLGAGYHTIQSVIAIGSGGVPGKGWLQGSQSRLDFIPERSTDFIFAVFAEDFGLIGAGALLLLYFLLIFRGMMIAFYTNDTYSRLLGAALSLTFFFYIFVNIGMVSGILPVVGVPLPLISYGGTSMVTLMIGFGMLMSIQGHKQLNSGY